MNRRDKSELKRIEFNLKMATGRIAAYRDRMDQIRKALRKEDQWPSDRVWVHEKLEELRRLSARRAYQKKLVI